MLWHTPIPIGLLDVPVEPRSYKEMGGNLAACDWIEPHPRITYLATMEHGPFLDQQIGHEVIHGWLYDSGLSNLLPEDMQEALCDGLSKPLVQLLRSRR